MLDREAEKYNETVETAARRGHLDIVLLMLEKGANNFNWAMSNAASQGHLSIAKKIRERMNSPSS